MKSEFEKWFKTTEAYKLIEEMNYFKVDLFTFKEHRSQYQHSAVQIAYMTYQHQQSKVDELKSTIEKQKKLSLKAIENAKAGSSLELQLAQKLHAESSPDSLESERAMNAQLTNENLSLESKVDELQKRVDAAQKLIDDWNFGGVHIFDLLDELEQALKGGDE